MGKRFRDIAEKYRKMGIPIADEEVDATFVYCIRKISRNPEKKPESYMELLFEEELEHYLFRRAVNAVTAIRSLEVSDACVACV